MEVDIEVAENKLSTEEGEFKTNKRREKDQLQLTPMYVLLEDTFEMHA